MNTDFIYEEPIKFELHMSRYCSCDACVQGVGVSGYEMEAYVMPPLVADIINGKNVGVQCINLLELISDALISAGIAHNFLSITATSGDEYTVITLNAIPIEFQAIGEVMPDELESYC